MVREIGDETVVYDTRQHRAHCLNRTAASVFRHSDGTRTAGEIAALVGANPPHGADEERVEMALERLHAAGLLAGEYHAARRGSTSRREVLRRVGLGAALLAPIVTSLVVPTPAEAAASACIPEADCPGNDLQRCYRGPGFEADCSERECQAGSCVLF